MLTHLLKLQTAMNAIYKYDYADNIDEEEMLWIK
jgi:hypothetical protein